MNNHSDSELGPVSAPEKELLPLEVLYISQPGQLRLPKRQAKHLLGQKLYRAFKKVATEASKVESEAEREQRLKEAQESQLKKTLTEQLDREALSLKLSMQQMRASKDEEMDRCFEYQKWLRMYYERCNSTRIKPNYRPGLQTIFTATLGESKEVGLGKGAALTVDMQKGKVVLSQKGPGLTVVSDPSGNVAMLTNNMVVDAVLSGQQKAGQVSLDIQAMKAQLTVQDSKLAQELGGALKKFGVTQGSTGEGGNGLSSGRIKNFRDMVRGGVDANLNQVSVPGKPDSYINMVKGGGRTHHNDRV